MIRLTRRQILGGSFGLLAGAKALPNELWPRYVPGEMLLRVSNRARSSQLESLFPRGTSVQPILPGAIFRPAALAGQNLWRVCLPGDLASAGALVQEQYEFASRARQLAAMGVEVFRNDVITVPLEPLTEVNDPLLPEQYHITATGTDLLWKRGITGTRDVPLIVVDTGVQFDHPDLLANLLPGSQVFYGVGLEDRAGHGTFVAGVGAAVANNGIGGSGIAPGCGIVSLKALDLVEILGVVMAQGTQASLLAALYHVLNNYDEAVVVMALGQYEPMPLLEEVIQAGEKQFLIVAAVGNDASFRSSRYPAAYSPTHRNVLSVTALNERGFLASFANNHRPTTDIAAYGVEIVSTYMNSGYAKANGTSFSAAGVGGLMVLCWSEAKSLGLGMLPEILKRSVIFSGSVDPRHAIFDPIPALLDATLVWKLALGPALPARRRQPAP